MVLAVLVAAVLVFWFFVVDRLIVREVEFRGSEAVRAVVDLDAADLSLLPLGIELVGLRVTNPSSPMQNALDVRRIAGRIDAGALMRGMLVVDALEIEGVRFGTPRSVSGALDESDGTPAGVGSFRLPSFELPSVDEVLAAEKLESLAQIESLRADLDSLEQRWRTRLDALPDKESFAAYEKRIEQVLDKGNPLAQAKALAELREQLKRDVRSVREAARDLESELATVQGRIRQARDAPAADLRRLRERYGLSATGVKNLSGRLFGEPVEQILQQALRFSEPLRTALGGEPAESEEVDSEGGSLQGFLIRVARVSLEFERGGIQGVVENITGDPAAFGQPTTFAFESQALPGLEGLSLTGSFDHVRPDAPLDSISFELVGYDAAGATLSESPEWPIRVARGSADVNATLTLAAAGVIDVRARLRLRGAQLVAPFRADSPLAEPMADAIEAIRELDVRVTARGTLSDYELKIESNADRTLSDAVGGMLRQQSARFERELGSRIRERTGQSLAKLERSERSLEGLSGLLGEREDLGRQVLEVKPKELKRQLRKLGLPF